MHQSFVSTDPPPSGKGGDYDFSVFNALLSTPPQVDKLEVKTMLFALPLSIENLPGVREHQTLSFPLHCWDNE